MSDTSKPSPYSRTDPDEIAAINIFEKVLDPILVKADIKKRDKYPNIDGYLELVDDYQYPIGKLEVQVKKLPDRYIENPRYECQVTFFNYVRKVSCYPVVLVAVNIESEEIHWEYISDDFIDSLEIRDGQKSKVIRFPPNNVLDGSNDDYIQKWRSISQLNKRKLLDYNVLRKSYIYLSKKSNPILGEINEKFQNVHIFLDKINDLLENEFSIIKGIYFPLAWKIGVIYYIYEDAELIYSLFPIEINKNDVQIKKIDKVIFEEMRDSGFGFGAYYRENPIKNRPTEFAYDLIKDKIKPILENKLLNHENIFLANEYLFEFIQTFNIQLGLDRKNEYDIIEIEEAFYRYLPAWMIEALNFLVRVKRNRITKAEDCLYRRPYFDPRMLEMQIMNDELIQISDAVDNILNKGMRIPPIPLGNDKYPFGLFVDFLTYLKFSDVKKIGRIYSPKDFSKTGGWIYNTWSEEALKHSLKVFFNNLSFVYKEIIDKNFPILKDELNPFEGVSKIIVLYKYKEEVKTIKDSPWIETYDLYSDDNEEIKIDVFKKGENHELDDLSVKDYKGVVDYAGKQYNYIWRGSRSLSFLYHELPMLNYIYERIERELGTYFENLTVEPE